MMFFSARQWRGHRSRQDRSSFERGRCPGWELHAEGTLRAVYQRSDSPFAVLIMECADLEQARAKLGTIPFVKAGATKFDTVIPLKPFTGFDALFASGRSSSAAT